VLEASLARANAALAARDLLIETLRGQIARLRRMQFGASSEKLTREIAQLELALEELETESAVPETGAVLSDTTGTSPCVARPPATRGGRPRTRLRRLHMPGLRRCATPSRAGRP
jgi:transposase